MRWLWGVWVAYFIATPASAVAEDALRFVLLDDGAFACEAMSRCDPAAATDCEGVASCGRVGTATNPLTYCHLDYDGFVCCDPDRPEASDECTLFDEAGTVSVRGSCLAIDGVSGIAGVCNYPERASEAPTFCVHADGNPTRWLEPCMRAPTPDSSSEGVPVVNWRDGDCDGDGATNGLEFDHGCDACNAEEVFEEGACVLTVMPPGDAGLDSGGPADGGADSGGRLDAARDMSLGAVAGPEFRGSGGCTCRATDGGTMSGGAFPVLVLCWAGWWSRRVGRQRGRGH